MQSTMLNEEKNNCEHNYEIVFSGLKPNSTKLKVVFACKNCHNLVKNEIELDDEVKIVKGFPRKVT